MEQIETYTDLGTESDYMSWLESAKIDRDEAEQEIKKCVLGARAQGASWAKIGTTLGISKQAAQQKYGALTATRPTVTPTTTVDVQASAPAAEKPSSKVAPLVAGGTVTARIVDNTEDQERADFWEAKRKYVVTVDGAIYSPRGENGWDLHKVLRNVNGRNFQRSYSDMVELINANEGLLYVSRDKYEGLVQNAAKDRECWIMAATERENSVTASPELTAEIKAMDEKLTAIQKQLKANRGKKGPAYKTGG